MPKPDFVLTRNTTSLVGTLLAAVSAILIVLLAVLELAGLGGGLRLQLAAYVILPGIMVLGLILLAIGIWRQRRRARREARAAGIPYLQPVVDLNKPGTRRALLAALALGVAAFIILVGAGYRGIEVLDATPFCAQACHTVMQPEASSHARSPHADVDCVDCHIGPGARWFVKAKINGTMELLEVLLNSYPRPIPTPLHTLRPARVVCEQCHWPAAFVGDRLVIHTRYGDDAANSPTQTVLLMHVGGEAGHGNTGIHWHVASGVHIRYLADPSRQSIYSIELTTPDGAQKSFKNDAVPPVDAQWRAMDCLDCHNRPTHIFATPTKAIDGALAEGRIDTSLPFVKREGLRVLQAQYPTQEQARTAISRDITAFYRTNYPEVASARASAVSDAAKVLGELWCDNVFPQMKVTWDTYANDLGHQESPGCLRCHDNRHVTAKGEKIPKKCELCHNVVAEDEPAPQVLKELE
jgi:NapC/NirT cytochrome c family, N-terminal region